MKRLIGGLFLLNLTAISLGLTAGEVSISDEEVLSQLLELRNFIDDKRDFTKGFKDLKPVLVQYRSSASKIDGVVPCNLSFNTDALHLSIAGYSVQADGTPITLRINVVYEWTDYVGYTIKTAKLEATNEFAIKTLKQTQANVSIDFEWTKASVGGSLDPDNIYNRIEEINNVLYIVSVVKYTNNTESSVGTPQFVLDIEIPEELGKKIIDYNGNDLTTSGQADISACIGFTGILGQVSQVNHNVALRHVGANNLRIVTQVQSIGSGASNVFTFRTFLTLL